jgi:ribonuclease BN (tRNA processing enzyme)
MSLYFLGNGSAFNPALGSTSCCFTDVASRKLLLIDCGPMVYQTLSEKKLTMLRDDDSPLSLEQVSENTPLLDWVDEVFVFITHLHCDHVGSLAVLCDDLKHKRQKNNLVTIVTGSDSVRNDIDKLLSIQGVVAKYILASQLVENFPLKSVKADRIKHVPQMESYALTLEFDEGYLFYSGDQNDPDAIKSFISSTFSNKIYRMYIDAAYNGSPAHMSMRELAEIIPDHLTKKVYCMHCDVDKKKYTGQAFLLGFKVAD